ncbi:MAG: metalloregulator ArsR/SmtB family transcription factor [bacterium]
MIFPEAGLLTLGDRNRLYLIRLLLDRPFSVGELTTITTLGQSLVSHHLAILARNGWVDAERDGRRRVYRVVADGSPLSPLASWIKRYIQLPREWDNKASVIPAPAKPPQQSGDLEDYLL